MHDGFRKPKDNTCSMCPREIEEDEDIPLPASELTLCGRCRHEARSLAQGVPMATVGSTGHSRAEPAFPAA